MRGVGVQGDIGDNPQVGLRVFQGLHRALHQAVRITGLLRVDAFLVLCDDREQGQCRYAQLVRIAGK